MKRQSQISCKCKNRSKISYSLLSCLPRKLACFANKHGRKKIMFDESDQVVRPDEIHSLLEHFSKSSYRVKGDSKVISPVLSRLNFSHNFAM